MSDLTTPPLSSAAETVLTFLESVGRRSEAEFYLRLFRRLPKESFALVMVRGPALSSAPGSLVEQLSFLADLGLYASIIVGAWSANDAMPAAGSLAASLSQRGLEAKLVALEQVDLAGALTECLQNKQIPLVVANRDAAFERIGSVACQLNTRKLVVLRQKGGLGPHGAQRVDLAPGHFLPAHTGGISVINLRADLKALVASGVLSRPDARLLSNIQTVLEHAQSARTTLSVTSPLALLNELFTVKGAGTLVKLGSPIQRLSSYADLDRSRLGGLLNSSFKRPLSQRFFDGPLHAIYLEANYRGAAIVQPGAGGAFLTKFAVDPVAQGEGIGQDLWRAMHRDVPKLYWRARPDNPILAWYKSVCDGFTHHASWSIFWRGYEPDEIPELVRDATLRPIDFEV